MEEATEKQQQNIWFRDRFVGKHKLRFLNRNYFIH